MHSCWCAYVHSYKLSPPDNNRRFLCSRPISSFIWTIVNVWTVQSQAKWSQAFSSKVTISQELAPVLSYPTANWKSSFFLDVRHTRAHNHTRKFFVRVMFVELHLLFWYLWPNCKGFGELVCWYKIGLLEATNLIWNFFSKNLSQKLAPVPFVSHHSKLELLYLLQTIRWESFLFKNNFLFPIVRISGYVEWSHMSMNVFIEIHRFGHKRSVNVLVHINSIGTIIWQSPWIEYQSSHVCMQDLIYGECVKTSDHVSNRPNHSWLWVLTSL